jgi:hypothetical protein
LGEVGLCAATEARAVASLGVAREQLGADESFALDPRALVADCSPCGGRVAEVLGKRLVVEAHREPRGVVHA